MDLLDETTGRANSEFSGVDLRKWPRSNTIVRDSGTDGLFLRCELLSWDSNVLRPLILQQTRDLSSHPYRGSPQVQSSRASTALLHSDSERQT